MTIRSRVRSTAKFLANEYIATNYLAQIITMVSGIVVLRWLKPDEMGMWQSMLLLDNYCMFIRLGVINGMNRQFPFLAGKGDQDGAIAQVETTFAFTVCIAVVLGVALASYAVLSAGASSLKAMSLITLAVHSTCNLYSGFNEATYRGNQTFKLLGRLSAVNSVIGILLLILVVKFGYAGFCVRACLIAVFYAALTHFLRPISIRIRFSWPVLFSLMKIGIPLFVQNYAYRVTLSTGGLLLLLNGGSAALGLYAPVNAVLSALAMLPNGLMSFFAPRQHHEYGRHGSVKQTIDDAMRIVFGLFAGAVPLAIIGALAIPEFVRLVTPQYQESIPAMQVAVVLGVLRVFNVASTVYATIAEWGAMFSNQTVLWTGHVLGPLAGSALFPEKPWFGVTVGLLGAYLFYIPATLLSLRSLSRRSAAN